MEECGDYEEIDELSIGSFSSRDSSGTVSGVIPGWTADKPRQFSPDHAAKKPPPLPPFSTNSLKRESLIVPKRVAPKPPRRVHTIHLSSSSSSSSTNSSSSSSSSSSASLPAVPPKPKAKLAVKAESLDSAELRSPNSEFDILPEEYSLLAFSEKFQDKLPMRVRVYKGFYGCTDRTSLSEGDIFNIHFVKKSKMVLIRDVNNGVNKIALNSAVQFGVIFDPNKNANEAQRGFTFPTVADILEQKTLPKVVRANTAWKGHGQANSVEKNEVLALKSVRKVGGRVLKAYSVTASMKKILPDSCAGNFTTKPLDIRLYMLEIVNHVKDPFPCKCSLFCNRSLANDLPPYLFSGVITLESSKIEASMIATSAYDDQDEDIRNVVEIPTDMDVEVQIMKPKVDALIEKLYEDTRILFEKFDPKQVNERILLQDNASTQKSFHSYVREGSELAGINLVTPTNVYTRSEATPAIDVPLPPRQQQVTPPSPAASLPPRQPQVMSPPPPPPASLPLRQPQVVSPPPPPPAALPPRQPPVLSPSSPAANHTPPMPIAQKPTAVKSPASPPSSQELEKQQIPGQLALEASTKQLAALQTDFTGLSRELTSAKANIKRIDSRSIKSAEDIAELRKEVSQISVAIEKLLGWSEGLQNQMDTLQKDVLNNRMKESEENRPNGAKRESPYQALFPVAKATIGSYESVSLSGVEGNKAFLANLNCEQVLSLLEAMDITQYQAGFISEKVNGELLLECDEEILMNELQVTSKLHRLRLIKIVTGQHSAERILKGEDPYNF